MAATLAIHAVIAAGLLWGLSIDASPPEAASELRAVTIDFEPPPPPPPPPAAQANRRTGNPPGPEGAKGEALPREAPEAALPLAVAPAAPAAGEGRDASAGAGIQGSGMGAGGSGAGDGGGGAGSPARRIAGALRDSDYPREAEAQRMAGTVGISFRVHTDGQVDRCTVARSSGHALLDDLTCRLFTARYRFRPATNSRGEAVETTLQTNFTWGTRRR